MANKRDRDIYNKTKYTLENFFIVSNAIEGIYSPDENKNNIKIYKAIRRAKMSDEEAMFYTHKKLGYLNDYCIKGVLRDYDVYVGSRKAMDYLDIVEELEKLFKKDYKTLKGILKWHIQFENIHPFGDGNGRVGRMLLLYQAMRHGIKLPEMFYNFNLLEPMYRKMYYSLFSEDEELSKMALNDISKLK